MKLTSAILLMGMTAVTVRAQNPNIITNTKDKLNTVQQQKTSDSNAALGISDTHSAKSPFHSPKVMPVKAVAASSHNKSSAAKQAQSEPSSQEIAVENTKPVPDNTIPEEPRAININGRRDPFISPVVSRSMSGSGCSTGKRCLAIDQINLRGVVKSEDGMIAVVVNALDKAYFLHENDPVFNGYVVRITGDSVIFKETVQDKFGKPFSHEVTKKLLTPAV